MTADRTPTSEGPRTALYDLVYRLHDDGVIDEDQAGDLCMALARSSRATPAAPSEPAPLDVERLAEALTHVRGAHNSEDQYGEGPPYAAGLPCHLRSMK